jgi:RNAse (barnase) inhibitor barstar
MKNIKQFFSIITIVIMTLFVSCDDDKSEDLTDTINKNGSIESDISVRHLDSLRDILLTTIHQNLLNILIRFLHLDLSIQWQKMKMGIANLLM